MTRANVTHTRKVEVKPDGVLVTFSSSVWGLPVAAAFRGSVFCAHLPVCFTKEMERPVNPRRRPSEVCQIPVFCSYPPQQRNHCPVQTLVHLWLSHVSRKSTGFHSVSWASSRREGCKTFGKGFHPEWKLKALGLDLWKGMLAMFGKLACVDSALFQWPCIRPQTGLSFFPTLQGK